MSAPSLLAVVNQFPAPSETFIARKLAGLSAAGVEVSVAARVFAPEAASLGLPLIPTAPWKHPVAGWSALGGSGTRTLARTIVDLQRRRPAPGAPEHPGRRRAQVAPLVAVGADIVHFEFSGIAVTYRDAFDLFRPAKLVVSCRGAAEQILPLSDPTRARALAEVFASVDLIHCVSDDMRQTVEGLGAPAAKILVNRPAVPVRDFAGLRDGRAAHGGPLRVLSVGRLHWKKGLDDGLRAVGEVARTGCPVEYRIVGEGAEREKLTFLTHELGLGAAVELVGMQRQEQVREQLAWADVLLLPSLSEGISNAVLEAMAAGLPVVATECGGMGEVIDSGVDGFVVPIGDHAAMAACLGQLAEDPEAGARMGAAAAVRARAEFDLSRQISVFAGAYKQLLGGDPPAGLVDAG
jgi:colanic acid/amylovoran biosynthesis glycosyltransferase